MYNNNEVIFPRCHKQEQMSICIRYTKDFEILERFLGFVNVSQSQTAASLLSFILSFLKEINLDNIPIIVQSYDGASVMSGCRGGVQTLLKKYHSSAVYIHCMAHRLNLVVIDMCKNVKVCTIICRYHLFMYILQNLKYFMVIVQ